MRAQFALSALTVALSVAVRAQDIDYNQIPSRCRDVCNPVAALTQYCDKVDDDDDDDDDDDNNNNSGDSYINCVCNYPNASIQVPLCAACVRQVETDDNDVYDIVETCRFSTTTYTSGATLAPSNSLSVSSGYSPATRTSTGTGTSRTGTNSPTSRTSITTSTATQTSQTSVITSVVTSVVNGQTTAVTTSLSTTTSVPTGAAAAITGMPLFGAAAAMAVLVAV